MTDPQQHRWHFYISDIIEFAGKVLIYTDGLEQADFLASGIIYDATLRNLQLIGEAAGHIPVNFRAAHPEIPWQTLIAVHNRLINSSLGVDDNALWSIIQDDLPMLPPKLKVIHDQAQT